MEKNNLNSESGGVFIELAVVTPIALSIWMFLVDFYMLSRTTTSMMQAARDAGIYFATDQNYQELGESVLSVGTMGNLEWEHTEVTGGSPVCSDVIPPGQNPARLVSDRAYYLLEGQGSYLNMGPNSTSRFSISTNNDGNKVSVNISGRLNSFFFYKNRVLRKSVTLRRMGPNCYTS